MWVVDERERLEVVDDQRPELLDGHLGWHRERVGPTGVQLVAVPVGEREEVLGGRPRLDPLWVVGPEEVPVGPVVEVDPIGALIGELAVVVAEQTIEPVLVRPPASRRISRMQEPLHHVVVGVDDGLTHHRPHLVGWFELSALLDAKRRQHPHHHLVARINVLDADDGSEVLEPGLVIDRQRDVPHRARVDEASRLRVGQL